MGECIENHALYDLELKKALYSSRTYSPELCDFTVEDLYEGIDTLLNTSDIELKDINGDNVQEILIETKIRTVKDTSISIVKDTVVLSY